MADWSALVKGFQGGADFAQDFRARRQLEKARDQALESGEYDLQSMRDFRKAQNPDAMGVLGQDYAAGNMDWNGQLEDPFAFKLMDWFKKKAGGRKKKKTQALDLGGENEAGFSQSNPGVSGDSEPAQSYGYGEDYREGGRVETEDDKAKERARKYREQTKGKVENATENVRGADRTVEAPRASRTALPESAGGARRLLNKAGRLAAPLALGATAIETASTPTEDYRKRFGLETDDPSLMGDIGVRALGAASDLGNALTFGQASRFYRDKQPLPQEAAPAAEPLNSEPLNFDEDASLGDAGGSASSMSTRRAALPSSRASDPEVVDFSNLDIDAKDVPNMQMDDWKRYRAQMIAAAQKSGKPDQVGKVNDMITDMQHKGFLNYGMQGFALQQAGNIRGAMAAYRAAFQYFPNGNDVEFGIHKDRKTGRSQIVGFGKDEKTGKVVPGTELVMDPERVSALLENFQNPQAFRMWTKDWRDFHQSQRKYEEVEKPLAQAQADYMANNAEARMATAEAAQLRAQMAGGGGGAGMGATMRNAERVFRERLGQMGLEDEPQADYLASVMSQVKAKNPGVPDNTIIQAIMTASKDGSLATRLQRMGISPTASTQRSSAIPMPADDDPTLEGLSPEEREWATRPAQ